MKNIKYRLYVLKKLYPYTEGVRKHFLLYAFWGIVLMAVNLLEPYLYSGFIQEVIIGRNIKIFILVILGYIVLHAIRIGISYANNYCQYNILNKTTKKIKGTLINKILNWDFKKYGKVQIGEIKMTIEDDVSKLSSFANTQTVNYLFELVKTIILLALMVAIEWRLTLFAVVTIPITLLIDMYISKIEKNLNSGNRENDKSWASWIHSTVKQWSEIRAFNLEKMEDKKFVQYSHKNAIFFTTWTNCWVGRVKIVPQLKNQFFMQFGLYFIGGLLIYNNLITVGALIVFAQYFTLLSTSVQNVSTAEADLRANGVYYDKVLKALEETDQSESGEKDKLKGYTIEFNNVTFGYDDANVNVVENISFKIEEGERVAIVGESGKGKTTILKLIMGMLSATKGNILWDGKDIEEYDIHSIHKKIGFVMQENRLFNTSIRENLLYGKEDATDEELILACKNANIYDAIMEMPNKFDEVIGENGNKLSGGQRQRLVLARLFLRDVSVFVFDEATSALDQRSEELIQQAISSIGEDKTIIVVAHRQSSLNICNRMIYL